MDTPPLNARGERLLARIRFGIATTLKILVVCVGATNTGLILRLSWHHPDLLFAEGCLAVCFAVVIAFVWMLPEEVNPVRLPLTIVQELLTLQVLRAAAWYAVRRREKRHTLEDLKVNKALEESRPEPQREPHDVRIYPPQR